MAPSPGDKVEGDQRQACSQLSQVFRLSGVPRGGITFGETFFVAGFLLGVKVLTGHRERERESQ